MLATIITSIGGILLIIAAIALLKSKDVFTMVQIIKISNFYVVPVILLGVELSRFSITSFSKIIAIIILNLVITHLICHTTLRKAMSSKITPDAKSIKKSF